MVSHLPILWKACSHVLVALTISMLGVIFLARCTDFDSQTRACGPPSQGRWSTRPYELPFGMGLKVTSGLVGGAHGRLYGQNEGALQDWGS